MTGEPTSPHEGTLPAPGVWRQFGAFVRRPVLPERATGPGWNALSRLARLFALDVLLTALLIGLLLAATAAGFEMPSHLLDGLDLGDGMLLAFILVGAPIGEEILFRGWLSGRPGHIAAVVLVLLGALAGLVAAGAGSLLLAFGIAGAVLALAGWLVWRNRARPPRAFMARHFKWFYFGSTLAFASVHLTNFTEGNAVVLLPLVLPQFVLGLVLGYARVTFGLWASVLLHAAHNALFISLALAGTS